MTNPQVNVPRLCEPHRRTYAVFFRLKPSDKWAVYEMTLQLLLFSKIFARKSIADSAENKMENVNGVLHEIGCLACYSKPSWEAAKDLIKRKGLKFATDVAYAKEKDAIWDKFK